MVDSPSAVAHSRLTSIQILRACAALLAISWHFRDILKNFPAATLQLPKALQMGYAGVDFFFVISGFVICHVAFRHTFDLKSFVLRRFYRIYPFYFLFTTILLAAWLVNPHFTFGFPQPTALSLLASYTIFPQKQMPFLLVGWSLEHEIIFYLLVAAVGLTGRYWLIEIVVGALFLIGVVFREVLPHTWDYHLLSEFHFEFLVGTVVYFHRAALARFGVRGPLVAGVALFLVTAHFTTGTPMLVPRSVGYGIASGLLLLGSLNGEHLLQSITHPRALVLAYRTVVRVGDASYALYLSHPLVMATMSKIALALSLEGGALVAWLALTLLTPIVFAVLFYDWVEAPFLEYIHRRLSVRRAVAS